MPVHFGTDSITPIYKGTTKIDSIYHGLNLVYRSSLLPSGYVECEYLESNGNQYIDTGIKPDNTTGFEVKLAVDDTQTDVYYLGVRENNADTRFGLGVYQGHFYLSFGTYFSDTTNWTISPGVPFEANLNYKESGTGDINGTYPKNITGTLEGVTFTRNIYLFRFNYSGEHTPGSLSRIYKCVITKGSDVVANFIPCVDDQGVPCMYDIVGKQAYYNAGTGQFKYAVIVPPIVLPTGYTQLEWIKSDGNQYIDTGYYPSQKTTITCDFMPDEQNSNLLNYVYGTYTANQACGIYMSYNSNVYGLLYGRADVNTSILRQWGVKAHSELSSSGLTINGSTYSISSSTYTAPKSLYLFKGNGSTRPGMIGKIYSCLIEEWGHVIQYLIPCLDNNGMPCMYDTVSKQTFYNLGTGEFAYKVIPKLPDGYTALEYIESTGTQYIDTGYYATNTSGINVDFAYTASGNAGLCGIFQGQAPRTDTLFITTNSGQTSSVMNLISQGNSLTNGVVPQIGTKYNAKINYLNDGKLILNNTTTGNNGSNGVVSTRTIKLFCRDSSGNLAYTNARIYECQISEDENVVRDLVPCLDNNGTPCMYDLVSKTTFYNAGSGTFSYG